MAVITIQDESRTLTEVEEIREFLSPFGIWYEKWDVAGRITQESTDEEVLKVYDPEIERLKQAGDFVTADIITVNPDTPGIDAMLDKFKKEHTHTEDEVRFTIRGNGVFHINPDNGPVFGIHVESGDLINVPRGTKHWFDLCDDKTIRAIRLFQDKTGWTPHYVEGSELHEKYIPLCLGPEFVESNTIMDIK